MLFGNGLMNFSTHIFPANEQVINFINFDLTAYESLNYKKENKSTEFYGLSFLEAPNDIMNNSQRVNIGDGCINIISVENKLKTGYKRKPTFPGKQRKLLLIQHLRNYFQQIQDNYLKKKMYIKEDWKKLSKKERDYINNAFLYRHLYIKQIVLLDKSLIIKAIFPFRQ